ncbi:putative Golgi reassembly stacking protein (GRASP homologue) [Leishmania braziliensis MHOM/BR/75/M2904]|uniref:Golgi reassembly stacking protein (GRASP homologue) n=3 Tax=Viannia TaxID=37616 RepID=A4HLV0_LEIBR|nr:putative Golgi reassembly stacking protein (GRASP homologue) [Leishmania braziliensis MHOM/BR/75/M2904]CAJ2479618.1 unnamed protein product [Leishmania braziliensis]CAM40796.1 putative Golgi reassembly stacking protein (GRASP homologue) [Leishmania braziliensis MHOM/BR/75/M2904]SYZ69208.1 Golgi_reassembly_stacking_protein_(GRASP_homologue) [Leishmania braziliensis MHOM/BR/75/M2904]
MGQDNGSAKGDPPRQTATGGAERSLPAGSASTAPSVASVPLSGVVGFQVVRLLPYSPAHKAGLVPFFDIITALDHVLLDSEGEQGMQFFKSYVVNHRGQSVCFTTYNLYCRGYRDVYCVPSDEWSGGGLLGCSIEWTRADACPERCVHVVDVLECSPAAYSRELKANRDYILGMQIAQEPLITLIKNQKDLYSRLEAWHEEQRWALERKQRFPDETVEVPHVLLFLVYNSENNTVKEVGVEMGTVPETALGISVATGLLHIIPSIDTSASLANGASLPVMSKFMSVGPSVAMLASAQHQQHQTLQESPTTVLVGAASHPPEQLLGPKDCLPQPPHWPLSEETHMRCDVTDSPAAPTTHPRESPVESYQQPYSQWPQPQHQSAETTLYPMPPPASCSIIPPPHDGDAGETTAAVQTGQETFNPFANEESPDYDVLEGAPLARGTSVVADCQLGQHTLTKEQFPSSSRLPPPLSPSPPSASLPAEVNGSHNHDAAPASYFPPPPPPPPQPLPMTAMPTFSSQRMPPPLYFPVFPGAAAAKRTPE